MSGITRITRITRITSITSIGLVALVSRALPAAVLACAVLLARAAHGQPTAPGELTDPIKYLHGDVYDLTPERLDEWEAARVSQNGLLVDNGSVTTKEFVAIERGTLNLDLANWLALRGDVRNDRDRQGSVTRLTLDLLGRLSPFFSLGPSGTPAAQKDQFALGAAALLSDERRQTYLLVRFLADSFLYNRLNREGGTRPNPVWHPQIEARLARGSWSIHGLLDAQTESDIQVPAAALITRRINARTEADLHARYATPALEASARLELTVLRDASVQRQAAVGADDLHTSLSRTIAQARAQLLFAPLGEASEFRVRAGLRLLHEAARGEGGDAAGARVGDGGGAGGANLFSYSRLEPGARLGIFWRRSDQQAELGYAGATAVQQRLGEDPVEESLYQDKAYGLWEYSFSPEVHLRLLLAWELQNRHFGGGNCSFQARF